MTFTFRSVQAIQNALDEGQVHSLQVLAASEVATQYYPHFDPSQPTLLMGLEGPVIAERAQRTLGLAYPPDHKVTLLGPAAEKTCQLSELASQAPAGPGWCLYIPPLPTPASCEALQDVVAHLRSPEGCPWDRELTWEKLRASLLEETYELLTALDCGDPRKVIEEQGDLLLQIVMQVQIAAEARLYRWGEVIQRIVDKLVRRHPHVFGEAVVSGTQEVLANWEAIKRAERLQNGEARSPLSGIPVGLPALAQADAYLERVSRLAPVEAPAAPWAGLAALSPDAAVTPEMLGEALFGMVAWARSRGLDAESALRAANARYAEDVAAAQQRTAPHEVPQSQASEGQA